MHGQPHIRFFQVFIFVARSLHVCLYNDHPIFVSFHFNNHNSVIRKKSKSVQLQACTGPEGSRKLRFPDYVTMAQDGGKVVNLTHRPPLPLRNAPGTHFGYRLSRTQCHSAIGRILCQWKILMKPTGIEPTTFWFVAQHLNHFATAFPSVILKQVIFYSLSPFLG